MGSALVTDDSGHRYDPAVRDNRLPRETKEREQYAVAVGEDGKHLLHALPAPDDPARLRSLPQVEVLRQVWVHQYWYDEVGRLGWRGPQQTRAD
ncbi:hypothetical protein OHV05_37235 (plasmid) [Kitasatospora sp. NBC_00070]|uniref:hypothetical protein n=1 Tax=Kitasatospora sp. NBC_00070 TaxID=2975962 RepID=UPI002F919A2F